MHNALLFFTTRYNMSHGSEQEDSSMHTNDDEQHSAHDMQVVAAGVNAKPADDDDWYNDEDLADDDETSSADDDAKVVVRCVNKTPKTPAGAYTREFWVEHCERIGYRVWRHSDVKVNPILLAEDLYNHYSFAENSISPDGKTLYYGIAEDEPEPAQDAEDAQDAEPAPPAKRKLPVYYTCDPREIMRNSSDRLFRVASLDAVAGHPDLYTLRKSSRFDFKTKLNDFQEVLSELARLVMDTREFDKRVRATKGKFLFQNGMVEFIDGKPEFTAGHEIPDSLMFLHKCDYKWDETEPAEQDVKDMYKLIVGDTCSDPVLAKFNLFMMSRLVCGNPVDPKLITYLMTKDVSFGKSITVEAMRASFPGYVKVQSASLYYKSNSKGRKNQSFNDEHVVPYRYARMLILENAVEAFDTTFLLECHSGGDKSMASKQLVGGNFEMHAKLFITGNVLALDKSATPALTKRLVNLPRDKPLEAPDENVRYKFDDVHKRRVFVRLLAQHHCLAEFMDKTKWPAEARESIKDLLDGPTKKLAMEQVRKTYRLLPYTDSKFYKAKEEVYWTIMRQVQEATDEDVSLAKFNGWMATYEEKKTLSGVEHTLKPWDRMTDLTGTKKMNQGGRVRTDRKGETRKEAWGNLVSREDMENIKKRKAANDLAGAPEGKKGSSNPVA